MTEPIRVLLVEDNEGDARLVQEALASNDVSFHVTHVERLDGAVDAIAAEQPDVVILDLNLPDSQGLATFRQIDAAAPHVPVVVLTVVSDETTAVSAVSSGAQEYLYKSELVGRALPRVVRYAIERHRLRTELAELSDNLQQLMRHAVHDLRTPVTAVAGVADLLSGESDDVGEQELDHLLRILRHQSKRLGNLMADLMDIARLHREAELAPTHVGDVVTNALTTVPGPGHVHVETDLAPDLAVQATPNGLERIVTNLLTNAYRHADSHVLVRVQAVDSDVEITVADDGPGVPESFVGHLFEDFSRAPGQEEHSGSGLGLSIVRRLATSFGGEVHHTPSDRLGGAAFVVSIPAAEVAAPA